MNTNYIQEANYNKFLKYGIRIDETTNKVALYDVLNMINSNCYDMLKQMQNVKRNYPYIFINYEVKILTEGGRSVPIIDIPNIILLIISLNVNCNPELIFDLITYLLHLKKNKNQLSKQVLQNELTLKDSEIKYLKKMNDENVMTYKKIIKQLESEITILKNNLIKYKCTVNIIQDKNNTQLKKTRNL